MSVLRSHRLFVNWQRDSFPNPPKPDFLLKSRTVFGGDVIQPQRLSMCTQLHIKVCCRSAVLNLQ